MEEKEALLALHHTPFLGPIKARLLIKVFGTAKEALFAKPQDIAALPGFGEKGVQALARWEENTFWKQDLRFVEEHGVQLISCFDKAYPKALLDVSDYPLLLYVKGTIKNCDNNSIAIVGTRRASIYGSEMAKKISREVANAGFTVVSGLARGIDTAAHCGALEAGRTIAFIGSGFLKLYPSENKKLADAVSDGGAVITEYPMLAPPDRKHFPQRNRLVAAMVKGALLIEAPRKSGAMITMQKAFVLRRRLFALPGRVDSENFKGNHHLIKNREAELIENGGEIAKAFNSLHLEGGGSIISRSFGPPLEPEEEKILDKMPQEELTIDELLAITSMPIAELNVLLMGLVLKKRIKEYPGKIYKKQIC